MEENRLETERRKEEEIFYFPPNSKTYCYTTGKFDTFGRITL